MPASAEIPATVPRSTQGTSVMPTVTNIDVQPRLPPSSTSNGAQSSREVAPVNYLVATRTHPGEQNAKAVEPTTGSLRHLSPPIEPPAKRQRSGFDIESHAHATGEKLEPCARAAVDVDPSPALSRRQNQLREGLGFTSQTTVGTIRVRRQNTDVTK